ncbi:MAG: hypothetical protein AAFQ24_12780 [Pseudomonadota bacterium]
MTLPRLQVANIVLTMIGTAVFASLFLYIAFAPKDFDERTREFAVSQIESKVDDQLATVANSETAERVSEFAGRISDRLQSRVDEMRGSLDDGIDELIAGVLAAACKLDCERRDQAARSVRDFYENSILRHSMVLDRLESLVVGEYDAVMTELRSDLRIFSGSTALAFGLAMLLSFFRGRAAAHLVPISIALTVSTILAVAWYALGQDWVMTVLFSNYWGWAYSVLLGGLSVLMIDIAANRARVTSFVFNSIGNGIGGISFSPC